MNSYRIPRSELNRLMAIAHEEIMRFFQPDCCVIATRVFIDVLERMNIQCAPLSVMAAFYGPDMARHVTDHACNFWSCHEKLDLGAAIVFLAMPPSLRRQDPARTNPADPFDGHVGVIVNADNGQVFVDLTVEQASHPEHGIPLDGPLSFPADMRFVSGKSEAVALTDTGLTIRYVAFPTDRWYTVNSPDWTMDSTIRKELTETVISRFNRGTARYSAETMMVRGILGRV